MKWKTLMSAVLLIGSGTTSTVATPLDWDVPMALNHDATNVMDLKGGPDGAFHMLYAQSALNAFYYFTNTDTGAYKQLIHTYPVVGTMLCSLAFWGSMPTGVYRYKMEENMEFNIRTGSSWTSLDEIPGTAECYSVSMDVEPDGKIHLAWVLNSGGIVNLMHSVSESAGWTHRFVATIGGSTLTRAIDMKLDSNQAAHFAWYDTVNHEIGYAFNDGGVSYNVQSVIASEGCRWIEIDFLSPDLPAIGYLEGTATTNSSLHYALKVGSSFSFGNVLDSVEIYDADMAVNRDDIITTTQWYFVVSLPTGIHYLYPGTGGWINEDIPEFDFLAENVNLSADWNSASQSVGMAVSAFTEENIYFIEGVPGTPGPTPTPWACTDLGCKIDMPLTRYRVGDTCYCRILLCNPGPKTYIALPVFVILDVYGSLFFAPTFAEYDHYTIDSFPEGQRTVEVLPPFEWPEGAGSATGIMFYAGMTDQAITELLGDYDVFTFGWE
ncbi:MAG TPA: hypothetical protein PLV45_13710 [bacterium]|nr:hypothetical protein [bacterium]